VPYNSVRRILILFLLPRTISSFELYLNPFQSSLWIGLILCIFNLGIYFHIYVYHRCKIKSKLLSFFLMTALALEQSYDLPDKITKLCHFHIVYGFWTIILVIFVNAYKGIASTSVSSPLQGKTVDEFRDLVRINTSQCIDPYAKTCILKKIPTYYNHMKFYINNQESEEFKIHSHARFVKNHRGTQNGTNFHDFLSRYFLISPISNQRIGVQKIFF